jgi:hypothetical protein
LIEPSGSLIWSIVGHISGVVGSPGDRGVHHACFDWPRLTQRRGSCQSHVLARGDREASTPRCGRAGAVAVTSMPARTSSIAVSLSNIWIVPLGIDHL